VGPCGLCPASEPASGSGVVQGWVWRSKFAGQEGMNPDVRKVAVWARGRHGKACGDEDSGAVALAAEQPGPSAFKLTRRVGGP